MVTENETRLPSVPESLPKEKNLSASEWMVIRTKRGKEDSVAGQLQTKEVETFIPEISSKRTKRKTVKLLPNYLFARIDPNEVQIQMPWIRTRAGVNTVLPDDGGYAHVPNSVIEVLKKMIYEEDLEVERGPLEGLRLVLNRKLPAEPRILAILEAGKNTVDKL